MGTVKAADHDQIGVLVDGKVWEAPAGFDHFRTSPPSQSR